MHKGIDKVSKERRHAFDVEVERPLRKRSLRNVMGSNRRP